MPFNPEGAILPRPYRPDVPKPNASSNEASMPDPKPLATPEHEAVIPEEDLTPTEEDTQEVDEPRKHTSEDERIPRVRTTFPLWLLLAVWAVPSVTLFYFSHKYSVRPLAALIAEVIIVGIVGIWWHDTIRTLRDRVPPAGWKSVIMPEKLANMSLSDFDNMRFELSGDNDDALEEHKVAWASRYSRVAKLWVRILIGLAVICPVGMLFVKSLDIGLGNGLPHKVNIIWVWPLLSALCIVAAYFVNLDWNYKRLMVDDLQIYDLKENPAWMPWVRGRNNVLRLEYVFAADPIDTSWGKRWGHGTVALTIQRGMDQQTIHLQKVPRHRDFCNTVNAMARSSQGGAGILM
jgi:hypothetical protein